MSKKLISLLLSLIMALSVFTIVPFTVTAAESEEIAAAGDTDGDYDYYVYDGTAEITGYIGSGGDVTIPSTIGGYAVTSIGGWAFRNCTGLTSVVIPDSVTSIGWNAFSGCTGLTSVVIPDSVTSIGEGAFSDCTGLTSVVIPDSVTSIGDYAFIGCTGLTSVVIPDSVTSIGWGAFYGCTGLTSMKVSEGNSVYDSRNNCNAIIETESNTLISGCKNTVIPDSVTSIGGWAFDGCTGLTSVVIPDSVTSIYNEAFRNCTGLTSVIIPDSVTHIGYGAFSYCASLTSMKVSEGNSVYDSRNNCNAIIETESNTLISGCKNTVIPDSVTSIGDSAFSGCTGLTSVVIPDSVTSIGYGAFSGCTGLTSVVIGSSVTSIGVLAFSGCTGLTSVVIPDSVTSIGWNAFSGCTGLTSMKVSEGNSVYDSRNNCNAIITKSNTLISGCKNTVIPDSVTSIGNSAFIGCTGLTSVVIPDSVTSIGYWAFSGCTGLTSVVIGSSVTSIGLRAFDGCSGLTSVKVSEGNSVYDSRNNCNAIIETESNTLLYGCNNTVIPDSVTSIGYSAFADCAGLTSVVIPDSVTSIGWYAFEDCTGLTSVVIPDSVTSIDYRALGYYYDDTGVITKIDGFTIYGHRDTAAETYANENGFRFIMPGEENGATVKGAVTSFIDESEVTVKLTGNDNDFTATVTGAEDYSIEDVPEGEYTLTVSKKDHVTREYTVNVAGEEVTQDVKINPVGDVNGDGSVSIADYSRINKHVCKVKAISGYESKCADVNGDGNVSIADLSRVNKHVCKVKKLW